MTEPTNSPPELELTQRPDPIFKRVTGQQAEAIGLRLINAELPQSLSADLVLEVPPSVNLEGTLFGFLKGFDYVVIDFKSENDTLDLPKLLINVARTALFCSRYPDTKPGKVLNLIISSRYPQDVLAQIKPDVQQATDHKWLWQGGPTYQPLAIVVCRDLPLEPVFYEWLAFAPFNSQALKNSLIEFVKKGRRDLVEIVRSLKRRGFEAMITDILKEYSPEEQARIRQEILETLRAEMTSLVAKTPGGLGLVLSDIEPQTLADELSEQQSLAVAENLTDEQFDELVRRRKQAKEQNN